MCLVGQVAANEYQRFQVGKTPSQEQDILGTQNPPADQKSGILVYSWNVGYCHASVLGFQHMCSQLQYARPAKAPDIQSFDIFQSKLSPWIMQTHTRYHKIPRQTVLCSNFGDNDGSKDSFELFA